jgi:hypothetical protein
MLAAMALLGALQGPSRGLFGAKNLPNDNWY